VKRIISKYVNYLRQQITQKSGFTCNENFFLYFTDVSGVRYVRWVAGIEYDKIRRAYVVRVVFEKQNAYDSTL